MEERKKILVISYYWPPSGGSGVQRWLKFVKYLHRLGWQPIVLTVDEKKASYFLLDDSLNAHVDPAIEVHRTNTFEPLRIASGIFGKKNMAHSGFSNVKKESFLQSGLRFLRGNLFLTDPRSGWNKHAIRKASALIEQHNIEYVVTTSPPHSTQLIGLKLKKKFNIKWIVDLRDPWTDIFFYNDLLKAKFLKRKERKLEQQVIEQADLIVTVSSGLKKIFGAKLPDSDKIHIIENGFDPDDAAPATMGAKVPNAGVFRILYVGVVSEKYKLDTFLDAVSELKAAGKVIHLTFVGIQSDLVKETIRQKELTDVVTFHPYTEKNKLAAYYNQSDMNLLAIPYEKGNEGIVTGKIFEYLSLKIPVLGIGPAHGDAAEILTQTNAGRMFDYNNKEGIKAYIIQSMQHGLTHTFTGIDRYSRKQLTEKLISLVEAIQ